MTGEEMPRRHLGDFPDGAYWSADPPAGADVEDGVDEVAHVPTGPVRFSWDYGVRVPLWDDTGLLPEDPMWLREALGLDDALVRELAQWGRDMEELDATPRQRSREAYVAMDARARELVARLRVALSGRHEVGYHPWVALED